MGDCCSKTRDPIVPISVEPHHDLVDIEHERTRQAAIALNIGKGPVKVEGKFRIGFEKESIVRYKRHPIEERTSSVDYVYEKIGPVPYSQGPPIRQTQRESSPISIPPRRNSK